MTVCESFLTFVLSGDSRHHEDVNPNDSTGVDLEVQANGRSLWIEVKNWESPTIPPAQLANVRASFVQKMASDDFWSSIARKAKGTHDVLEARNERPQSPGLVFLYQCNASIPGAITASILEREVKAIVELSDVITSVVSVPVFRGLYQALSAQDCALNAITRDCLTRTVYKCSRERQLHR